MASARELYEFLEVKTQFADWIKSRIIKYGFLEGEDYVAVSKILENGADETEGVFQKTLKNPKGGRIATDYALTLDMAKELSMVERNAKGKQARQFFIECEKQLRTVIAAPALTTEQVLLQQAHRLVDQQNQIDQLRQEMTQFMENTKPVVVSHSPVTPVAFSNRRQAIARRVDEYCGFHGVSQLETYNFLYRRLNDVYRISVYRLIRKPGESLLNAVERYGHLDKLYGLIMAELTLPDEL